MSKGKLILVDGSSYLYRAFHALPPLTNSKGHPTGAIYGVINMINKLLHDQGTDHFVVIFDAPGKTFRNDLYSEYKANRASMPDDLRPQIEPIHEIIKAMGLPLIMIKNVEADDVIGTLSKEAAIKNMDVIISTGDKDMAQLVDQNITLINTMNDEILDRDGVKQKFDVYPEQVIDYLTLMGDKADNIPGIPGVGAKTASKWLNKYLTLENLINNSDEITGKIGEKLRANLSLLPLSKKLVTIDQNLDLSLKSTDLKRASTDNEKLKSIYKELELKTFYSQISETKDEVPLKKSKSIYKSILHRNDLMKWVDRCKREREIAIDTETNSLNYIEAELVGISLSINEGKAIYIPLAHDYKDAPLQLNRMETLNILKPILEDEKN
jgi:DNA polymerase-1